MLKYSDISTSKSRNASVPLPLAFQLVVVPCPACGKRNAVDRRRVSATGWPACGGCGGVLPRRWPKATIAVATLGPLLLAATALIVVQAVAPLREKRRVAEVRSLLDQGRAPEAAARLGPPPHVGSEADLALDVARGLALPVVTVEADDAATPEGIEKALATGDRLVAIHASSLPEVVGVLDPALQRLQRRRQAAELLEPAWDVALRRPADTKAVRAAVDEALARARSVSAAVHALARRRAEPVLDAAAIGAARERARQGRMKAARQALLERRAARDPAGRAADPPALGPEDEPSSRPLAPEPQLRLIRDALVVKDVSVLRTVLAVRATDDWPEDLAQALDAHVRAACLAVASIDAERAAAEERAGRRADIWLEALTCDELLPAGFLDAARRARAVALLEASREGGPAARAAASSWSAQPGGADRDAALGELACRLEEEGDPGRALDLFALVGEDAALRRALPCAGAELAAALTEPAARPAPTLPYPYLPDWPLAREGGPS
jgi:hypothetical protein